MRTGNQRLVFFGGKGGVGKTSSSAAYAAGLAAAGQKVLVLSTDPAHSLGDALSEKLSGTAREVAENLWAMEVDPTAALEELRQSMRGLDAKAMLDGLGLPGGTTAALGLEELSELLEAPPPGIDEIVAIARVTADITGYDVVVFDTAPTGHTLRLLEVPQFLAGFLDRALSVRKSLGGILSIVGMGFGGNKLDKTLDEAEVSVKALKDRVAWLGSVLRRPPSMSLSSSGATSEFVVVTRPTRLDCAEADRLVAELKEQGICCRSIVVNQVVEATSSTAYWKMRVDAQGKVLSDLRAICGARNMKLVEVTDRPESLVGVPALSYLSKLAFDDVAMPSGQVTIFGGKGGVGKTSMSSALAVRLAEEGQRVLVISTDPAHSLGDALGSSLPARAQPVAGFAGSGELWAMEVNTAAAIARFQKTIREALKRREQNGGIVGQVLQQLPMEDFVTLFDTLPPGSDEVVALVEVLEEVKSQKFDRIIIDTAPTGHALRLLSYPDFLERLADRVARLRDRFGWLTGDDSSGSNDQLRSFQLRMIELQDLFTDAERTSFAVVTIPTVLALEESKRLLQELDEQGIRVGLVIANRILDADRAAEGLQRLLQTQAAAMDSLTDLAKRSDLEVIRVPYLDTEVRGIYGLQYFATNLKGIDRKP